MMTLALSGQDIGGAERAMRAVLERLLATTGTTFLQWVVLNLVATAERPVHRQHLVKRATAALKAGECVVLSTLGDLVDQGLLTIGADLRGSVALTEAGEARYRLVRSGIDLVSERLDKDLPPEDVATAHRVLAAVTERTNAELAQ